MASLPLLTLTPFMFLSSSQSVLCSVLSFLTLPNSVVIFHQFPCAIPILSSPLRKVFFVMLSLGLVLCLLLHVKVNLIVYLHFFFSNKDHQIHKTLWLRKILLLLCLPAAIFATLTWIYWLLLWMLQIQCLILLPITSILI